LNNQKVNRGHKRVTSDAAPLPPPLTKDRSIIDSSEAASKLRYFHFFNFYFIFLALLILNANSLSLSLSLFLLIQNLDSRINNVHFHDQV